MPKMAGKKLRNLFLVKSAFSIFLTRNIFKFRSFLDNGPPQSELWNQLDFSQICISHINAFYEFKVMDNMLDLFNMDKFHKKRDARYEMCY